LIHGLLSYWTTWQLGTPFEGLVGCSTMKAWSIVQL
jgi:hypothetical protein